MASSILNIRRDKNSIPTFVTVLSDERAAILLAADTNATIPVPSDASFAIISYDTGKDVFVSDAAITLPLSSTPVTNAGVLLKPSIDVSAASFTTLNFRSNEVAYVSVEFYR